jgi:transcriptional regulator with XRE-family HTH domain
MGERLDILASHLADNLKYLRERRGWTQSQLASLAGVPRSTLANIETGAGNPTLSVLSGLVAACQVSMEELLSPPRGLGRLIPSAEIPTEVRGSRIKAVIRKLLPDPIPGMEIDRMEIPAGGRIRGVPHRAGTREYLCCERGQIVLHAGGERYDLRQGDVCTFRGDLPHSYRNEGQGTAVGFSVVTLAPI